MRKSAIRGIGGSWRIQLSNTAKRERKRTRHTYTLVIETRMLPKRRTIQSFTYEVRPRKDKRGVDVISDALPFGRLCGTASQTQSAMQSATQAFTAAHTML